MLTTNNNNATIQLSDKISRRCHERMSRLETNIKISQATVIFTKLRQITNNDEPFRQRVGWYTVLDSIAAIAAIIPMIMILPCQDRSEGLIRVESTTTTTKLGSQQNKHCSSRALLLTYSRLHIPISPKRENWRRENLQKRDKTRRKTRATCETDFLEVQELKWRTHGVTE